MLEITILKTKHSGITEARKLASYIENSDAFSLEQSLATEGNIAFFESEWEKSLNRNYSRTRVVNWIRRETQDQIPKGEELGYEYDMVGFGYMIRNGVCLYHTERFEEEHARKLLIGLNSAKVKFKRGLREISQGKQEDGIQMCYEAVTFQETFMAERDKNMADNLTRAEDILRSTYSKLRDREIIRLGIQLGFFHRIEEYVTMPIRIVNLMPGFSEAMQLDVEIDRLAHEGKPIDDFIPVFLRSSEINYRMPFS